MAKIGGGSESSLRSYSAGEGTILKLGRGRTQVLADRIGALSFEQGHQVGNVLGILTAAKEEDPNKFRPILDEYTKLVSNGMPSLARISHQSESELILG